MAGPLWTIGLVLSLCISTLAVRVNLEKLSWQKPSLPNLLPVAEIEEGRAVFQGHVHRRLRIDCDLECQISKGRAPLSMEEIERSMSYETLDVETETRIKTVVNVSEIPDEILRADAKPIPAAEVAETESAVSRKKRAVFGFDTRFTLPTKRFSTMSPFSTVVRLSTGCAGMLISPKHVLTSAHCIHDGKKYLKGVKKLRVGRYIKKKVKKGRGKRKKGRKNRKKGKKASRSKRNAAPLYVQKFRWMRAKRTHIPQAWLQRPGQSDSSLPVEHDYAVLELKKPLGKDFMKLGISPAKANLPGGGRIHFTAFNGNKNPELLYRYCLVEEQSSDVIYNHCDAERGTSGSGIYIRLFDRNSTAWDRRVIGVYSGHQWVEPPQGGPSKEYNTGVRITALKYAQICFWTTGDYSQCRDG